MNTRRALAALLGTPNSRSLLRPILLAAGAIAVLAVAFALSPGGLGFSAGPIAADEAAARSQG